VAFSQNSSEIACGTDNGSIEIWNCRNGNKIRIQAHKGRVNAICFGEDLLVSGGDDKKLCLWKKTTQAEEEESSVSSDIWKWAATLLGHRGAITSIAMSENIIASGSVDKTVRIFSLVDHSHLMTLEDHKPIFSISISKDGKTLAAGGAEEKLRLWDLKDGSCQTICENVGGDIRGIHFSRNFIAFCCGSNVRIQPLRCDGEEEAPPSLVLKGHHSNIRSICISHDDKILASACSSGMIRLWRVQEGLCVDKFNAHNNFLVSSLSFASTGRTLLSSGSDGTIALWNSNV
jgi:WD40 repeat protein